MKLQPFYDAVIPYGFFPFWYANLWSYVQRPLLDIISTSWNVHLAPPRSDMGEAAIEGSQRVFYKEIKKGHKSGQGHVKGQKRHISPYQLPRLD